MSHPFLGASELYHHLLKDQDPSSMEGDLKLLHQLASDLNPVVQLYDEISPLRDAIVALNKAVQKELNVV
ncbi:uncharacterized protein JN550_006887 [Neoarthrinium moseri]|uniref:uncharacterized protein n=1 Tax=Neoarthrinium moseri TaxID=1658444 RepID=UPI001FDBAA07|nr:uncharacterized protein JN550_006887 [Neoarthrinium moseri]KAI1867746.1 hypothetical protein JN550_006887 [Neoarthrinium moseri]